jgi:hypothetical protein
LYRVGSPGTITVSIRATGGASPYYPSGADLCSGTYDGNTLTTDTAGAWVEITFGAGYALTNGTIYSIVMRAPSGDISNRAHIRIDITSSAYANGHFTYSGDAGVTWETDSNAYDIMFENWGDAASTYQPRHGFIHLNNPAIV